MSYQGHCADGSSVQKHSAGAHYPYVVGKYERQTNAHFCMAPDGSMTYHQTGLQALETAEWESFKYRTKQ